jgi:NAD+ synthase (glutamine-hydrolysing)
MVGGQDELVFDGDSLIADADGRVIARAVEWEQHLLVTDLELPVGTATTAGPVDALDGTMMAVERVSLTDEPVPAYPPSAADLAPPLLDEAEIWGALVTGTRDYVHKTGFRSVVIALSGGIDSAVTATIAADALGPENVHAVGLPSVWSSDHSLLDAEELTRRQGINWSVFPISEAVDAWKPLELSGLAAENLQARVRGVTVMALANEHGHLVLTAGNKSELATGYSTLYGADTTGAYAPLKDVFKSMVWRLARWRNTVSDVIPQHSIDKPPSAELAPGQLDSDSLPPYEVLDALLEDYVEHDHGRAQLIASGHDEAMVDRVIKLVDKAEYKRRQYPPGPKITSRAFGRDWRLPIASRWREQP